MDGKKVQKGERDKKSWREGSAAGAQGTFSLWLVFFLDVPRCRLQTSKPKARPRDRGERGRPLWVRVHAERRAAAERTSTRGEKHDLTVFRRLCLQHQPLRLHLARIRTRAEKPRSQVWLSRTIVLVPFCDEMNHHIRSYLQTPPSVRSIQLLSNDWKKEPELPRSSALNLNSYFNLSTPAVLSVPAEREASTYCQHKSRQKPNRSRLHRWGLLWLLRVRNHDHHGSAEADIILRCIYRCLPDYGYLCRALWATHDAWLCPSPLKRTRGSKPHRIKGISIRRHVSKI